MTCNITERFNRIVAGTTLFVLLTAFNTAWTAEIEGDSSISADARSDAMLEQSGEHQSANAVAETTFEYVETVAGIAQDTIAWTESNAAVGSRAQAEGNVSSESAAESDGNASTDGAETDGQMASNSKADANATVDASGPDAEPLLQSTEAFADATYRFVDDINTTAQDAVAETVAQEIGAAVDASVKEDVRASVEEDLQAELTGSLPLPGQD